MPHFNFKSELTGTLFSNCKNYFMETEKYPSLKTEEHLYSQEVPF